MSSRKAVGPARDVARITSIAALNGGSGDRDLRAAAEIIRDGEKALASSWSRSIPGSIGLRMDGSTAVIAAGAPVARPAELRLRHPLFGNREHWYGPPGSPFLAPAADAMADPALARYAVKLDRWARAAGFK